MVKVVRKQIGEFIVESHWDGNHIGATKIVVELADDAREGFGIGWKALTEIPLSTMRPVEPPVGGDLTNSIDYLRTNARRVRGGIKGQGGTRQGYPDEFWAMVALTYCQIRDAGYEDGVWFIADETDVKKQTVLSWIESARQKGMLTRLTHAANGGRMHGVLTDKAKEILGV